MVAPMQIPQITTGGALTVMGVIGIIILFIYLFTWAIEYMAEE